MARFASGLVSKGHTMPFQQLFHTMTGARALLSFLSLTEATFQLEEGRVGGSALIDQLWIQTDPISIQAVDIIQPVLRGLVSLLPCRYSLHTTSFIPIFWVPSH